MLQEGIKSQCCWELLADRGPSGFGAALWQGMELSVGLFRG